jgi:predicted Fe-Mo cluster-binding NifX family protein
MKIAVPINGQLVESHFGQCHTFAVFHSDNQKTINATEVIRWEHGCGCKSNLVATLKEMGVTVLLAGNMGQGALNTLMHHGIEVVRGSIGNAHDQVQQYLDGKLSDRDILCSTHHAH